MSLTIQDVFSDVQNELNDLAMNQIQLGEYVSFANDIAMEVAQNTEIYIGRYRTIPVPIASAWDSTTAYIVGDICELSGTYYLCILAHTNHTPPNITYWTALVLWNVTTDYDVDDVITYSVNGKISFYKSRADSNIGNTPTDDGWWIYVSTVGTPKFHVNLPYQDGNNIISPYKLLRVCRGDGISYNETNEYSQQAIARGTSGNKNFSNNDVILDANNFGTQFVNNNLVTPIVDNSLTLIFNRAFEPGEEVVIDFIQAKPFNVTVWNENPSISVPDFMNMVFKYGILSRCLNRLYNKGNENMGKRADRSMLLYNKELMSVSAYARNYRNKGNSIIAQPIKWLRGEE
jgi:hypothetical protein